MVTLTCLTCQKLFDVVESRVNKAKYCCLACRKTGKWVPCSWCKDLVYRPKSTLGRQWFFCSSTCDGAYKKVHQTGINHPRFQTTMTLPPFTAEQQALILGSLLGDASLQVMGTGNAFFQVAHSHKQVAYLEYKRQLLAPFASHIDVHRRHDARFDRIYETHRFHTSCHWWLTELRRHLYIRGRKELTAYALKHLTPCALAFWFMDDGTCSQASTLSICTVSFRPAHVAAAARKLGTWGLDAWEKKGRLWISAASKEPLRALIAPWFHDSMAYKLRTRPHTVLTLPVQLPLYSFAK